MFITAIKGGLGNQLFQYAFGYHINKLTNREWLIDKVPLTLKGQTSRELLINYLEPSLRFCDVEMHRLFATATDDLLTKAVKKIRRKTGNMLYVNENEFNSNILKARNKVIYFDGYWQNIAFAKEARAHINDLFEQRVGETGVANDLTGYSQAVAVHIRRGDYVSDKIANRLHGVLPLSYYQQAIDFFQDKYPGISFIFFSDDIEWVKENMGYNSSFIYSPGNNPNPVYDLYRMKKCKHQIISNSSFSWWAAFLNSDQNKEIIAPKNWTTNRKINDLELFDKTWKVI